MNTAYHGDTLAHDQQSTLQHRCSQAACLATQRSPHTLCTPMPRPHQLRVGGLRLRALSLRLQRRQQLRRHKRLDRRHAQVLRLVREETHAPPAVLAVVAQLAAIPARAQGTAVSGCLAGRAPTQGGRARSCREASSGSGRYWRIVRAAQAVTTASARARTWWGAASTRTRCARTGTCRCARTCPSARPGHAWLSAGLRKSVRQGTWRTTGQARGQWIAASASVFAPPTARPAEAGRRAAGATAWAHRTPVQGDEPHAAADPAHAREPSPQALRASGVMPASQHELLRVPLLLVLLHRLSWSKA